MTVMSGGAKGAEKGAAGRAGGGVFFGRQLTCVKTAAFSLKKWDPEL